MLRGLASQDLAESRQTELVVPYETRFNGLRPPFPRQVQAPAVSADTLEQALAEGIPV